MLETVINDAINRLQWDEFVEKHPRGTIFQTYAMYEMYRRASRNLPFAIAVQEDGKIIGIVLSVVIWNGGGILRPLTARSIIIGGPLALGDDGTIIERVLSDYRKQLPGYVVYSEIRPVYDTSWMENNLARMGYERKGHYNLILSLKPEEEDLFASMHKKRKREIKKSIEFGLHFKELQTQEEKDNAVELIKQTYRRKRVPMSYAEMLPRLTDYFGNKARYFGAFIEERMIASKIDLCFGNLVYAWFAGSDEKAFSYYPNDFLMWKLIVWAKENGYEYLDFGGGGEPGVPYGVRDYKLKYGCQMFDYGRYQYFHRPLMYKIGEFGAKMMIKR